MHLGSNGFSAWITVDDAPLTEYGFESLSEKECTCWVPSQAGKHFAVHFADDQRRQVAGYTEIDGQQCGGKVIRVPNLTNSARHDAFQLTSTTSTPFVFSSLELTDDDDFLNAAEQVRDMGKIEVKMYRCVPIGEPTPMYNASALPYMHNKVHERSKKGIVHGVSFGEIQHSAQHINNVNVHFVDSEPFKFTFRYRPLNILQAEGIAPRPQRSEKKKPKPEAVIVISDDDDEDEEEVVKLEAKLKRARAKQAGREGSSSSKRVKREEKQDSVPQGKQKSTAFIDLT